MIFWLLLTQNTPGESLTKEELQYGVDAANGVAESYQKSRNLSLCLFTAFSQHCHPNLKGNVYEHYLSIYFLQR